MPEPERLRADEKPAQSSLPVDRDQRRVWQSEELLSGKAEAVIVHRGQVYRLRCTRQGKLILYK